MIIDRKFEFFGTANKNIKEIKTSLQFYFSRTSLQYREHESSRVRQSDETMENGNL